MWLLVPKTWFYLQAGESVKCHHCLHGNRNFTSGHTYIHTYIMASCREEIQMYQWLFFRQGALYSVHINNSQKRLLVFTHLFMCMLQWSEIVVQKTWARRNKCSHGDCMWCMPRADWASDTQFQLQLRCLMWNRSNHLPVDSVPVDVSANYQWMWTLHGCMSVPAMAMRTWMNCF